MNENHSPALSIPAQDWQFWHDHGIYSTKERKLIDMDQKTDYDSSSWLSFCMAYPYACKIVPGCADFYLLLKEP